MLLMLLLISALMASAMGFRKLVVVAAQDWAREVFQPPPIQAMWDCTLPQMAPIFWQVF